MLAQDEKSFTTDFGLINAPGRLLATDPGHDRRRSMGPAAISFMTAFCRYGRDGGAAGKTLLDIPMERDWMEHLVDALVLDKDGHRLYWAAVLNRPKGCAKSELQYWMSLWFAFGPAKFDHWAEEGETYTWLGWTYTYRKGEPVGVPFEKPLIDLYALNQKQSDNTYGYLRDELYQPKKSERTPEWEKRKSPFHELPWKYQAVGMEQITTPNAMGSGYGTIQARTTNGDGSDGSRTVFLALDEVHTWVEKQPKRTWEVTVNNMSKASAIGFVSITTTAEELGQGSVGEELKEGAQTKAAAAEAGAPNADGVLYDWRYAPVRPSDLYLYDERGLLDQSKVDYLVEITRKYAYAGRAWVRVIRSIQANLQKANPNISNWLRYFANQPSQLSSSLFDMADLEWASYTIEGEGKDVRQVPTRPPGKGDKLHMALDYSGGTQRSKSEGAVRHTLWIPDNTVLVAYREPSDEEPGGSFHLLNIWAATEADMTSGNGWRPPEVEIDAAVAEAFAKFDIRSFFVDPSKIPTRMLDGWHRDYHSRLPTWADSQHAVSLPPQGKRWNDIIKMYTTLAEGFAERRFRIGRQSKLIEHFSNVRGQKHGKEFSEDEAGDVTQRQLWKFMKHTGDEADRKIDAAVACAYAMLGFVDSRTKRPRKTEDTPMTFLPQVR